jgi:FixJ family two-component response regulator
MTEEQPVVFVIDDDASVRDAVEDLLRSVGLAGRVVRVNAGIRSEQAPGYTRLHRA